MSEQKTTPQRPLSPHLQVYRLPMTAKMSISHRITGVLLVYGLLVIAAWLIALALGEAAFNTLMEYTQNDMVKYGMLGWAFVLFYHMANGFRHMLWDIGWGLNEKASKVSGLLVILFAVIVTALIWYFVCGCHETIEATQEVIKNG